MKSLTCAQIRERWINFFTGKGHKYYPSSSLIPDNPTLLLNAAGMVQFVPFLLGIKAPPNPPRAVSIQKCVRVGGKDSDLDNIGRTSRHHSFFEMLGNFSFGDYFKKEAIEMAWQFVTEELQLPKDKLSVSVFAGDDKNPFDEEAYKIWFGIVPADKIRKMGRKDNFWGPPGPTGPCGPCSEIYFDRGAAYNNPQTGKTVEELIKLGQSPIDEHPERFVEIWNLVFMEFNKDDQGKFTPLARKNIDTGAGLERIAMILQEKENTFETDELFKILQNVVDQINAETNVGTGRDLSLLYIKIVTDHLRCLVFLIADGVRPSNLGRGYVLRMIIRRAARFAYLLKNSPEAFSYKQVNNVINVYKNFYPELEQNRDIIIDICKKEEELFAKTIAKGSEILSSKLNSLNVNEKTLAGDFVFDLYSTYGFPLELTQEIVQEKGFKIDVNGYEKAKEMHSQISNTDAFNVSLGDPTAPIRLNYGTTKFLGYETLNTTDCKLVKAYIQSQRAFLKNYTPRISTDVAMGPTMTTPPDVLILDKTPFYAESGGQVGDKGILRINGYELKIQDVKSIGGIYFHYLSNLSDLKVAINEGDTVEAIVDPIHRKLTKSHHSSCHLLQAALKKTLGNQIQQAGSQVGPEYTRFDFNFDRALTKDELKTVEEQINKWIKMKLPVTTKLMSYNDAIKAGALAFFEDKYDTEGEVRVLVMGDERETASVELCGGTHVSNTGEIDYDPEDKIDGVVIVSESSVAAGIRRIKLHANRAAVNYLKEKEELEKQQQEEALVKEQAKQIEKERKIKLEQKVLSRVDEIIDKSIIDITVASEQINKSLSEKLPESVSHVRGVIANVNEFSYGQEEIDSEILKKLVETIRDKLKSQYGSGFVCLGTGIDSKAVFIAACTGDLVKDKKSVFNASEMVKTAAAICGGGGGGRPDFAQAGGRDVGKLEQALEAVKNLFVTSKIA